MPPSIISPTFQFAKVCCGGIFISSLCPPWPYMENLTIHNKNGRTLWLRRTRGRLELTVPGLATYWQVIHRPSVCLRGGRLIASWWWCENCIAFSDRTHSAFHRFMIFCPAELSHYEFHCKPRETVMGAIAVSPRVLHSSERGRITETNYHYSIISLPHTCS